MLDDANAVIAELAGDCRSEVYSTSWSTWYENIQNVPYDELAEALQNTMTQLEAATAAGERLNPYPHMALTVMEWCDCALNRGQRPDAQAYLDGLFLACYELLSSLFEDKQSRPDEGDYRPDLGLLA